MNKKPNRIALLNQESKMIDKLKFALKDIFDSFASNNDGSMKPNDLKRFMLCCGAGYSDATSIVNQSFAHKDRLIFDEFSVNAELICFWFL